MQEMEIISLRTAGINEKAARTYMKKFCRIVEKHDVSKAHFYTHSSIPGDLALVITSETKKDKVMGTDLGNYMADVLKQFGLVDYNCWLMVDYK
jgi:hypothetical protein